MAQSMVYFADTTLTFFLNFISVDLYVDPVGQPFLPLSKYVANTLFCVALAIKCIELALGTVFNIYRTFIALRPTAERTLLVNLLPITAGIVIALTTSSATLLVIGGLTQKFRGFEEEYVVASTMSGIIPTLFCYILIERHFKNLQITDQVRKMQRKFSLGFALQYISWALAIHTYTGSVIEISL
ncbi:hypothetical protein ANCCAN_15746 [Ancylostoma caninum]|uniref:Uncharacterized protein n=1 Tax=Ancylostoma caninum TaxID=29170 RepID=A0A368G1I4_ANCCA|nr:hypothetical protein ANCCAN_15746 [Ancylostoma caninum]